MPVVRKGPPEEARRTLDKVGFLLSRGQSVLVFPEGGRSRVGHIDSERVMSGVGRMLQEAPAARVLCVFARGVGQREFSNYPRPGETFFVRLAAFTPETTFQGMRADRDLAMQIVGRLTEMEQIPPAPRTWIGNDIVDLAEPGVAGKEHDRRFMDRVFTPEERQRIFDAAAPTIALWRTWAAKETRSRLPASCARGEIAHRRFEVGPDPSGPFDSGGPAPASWVSVNFEDLEIRVRWETALDYIHCIGQLARRGGEIAPADLDPWRTPGACWPGSCATARACAAC